MRVEFTPDLVITDGVWVDVRSYGSAYTDATISAAISDIGSDVRTLVLPHGAWDISNNLTIPLNITFKVLEGAVLTIAIGKTLTINGPIDAGLYQIFNCVGTGKVAGSGPMSEVFIQWWGAVNDGTTDCSAAVQAAIVFQGARGGGVAVVPSGNYLISEIVFGTALAEVSNVILEGRSGGYSYGNAKTTSNFICTSGVWAFRLSIYSAYCELRNLGITSNGVPGGGADGVEYGVLIENAATVMRGVTVANFQYGCVIANGGNSNIFDSCAFVWNTKVGFATTYGSAACYALYHPNLTAPATLVGSTVFHMYNCNIRRNAWGMILRDGGGTFDQMVIESNLYGGIIEWKGTNDSSISGVFNTVYLESNWVGFDPTLLSWRADSIIGNNLLLDTAGVPIALTDDADNSLSDFGYQLTIGGLTPGTQFGPIYQEFINCGGTLTTNQKHIFVKQAFDITFIAYGGSGGDTANAVRLGDVGGFYANAIHFYECPQLPAISDYSNRSGRLEKDTSHAAGYGGYYSTMAYRAKMLSVFNSTGGLDIRVAKASADITVAASISIAVAVPIGAKLLGAQIRVDEALTAGETWNAAYSGGNTTAIATTQAVAANTKVNTLYDVNAAVDITTNTTNIAITRSAGGSFTALGAMTAWVYFIVLSAVADA
jgi:hypothetical protein